ncbi:MAG TPA: 4-alpha-glucanotransferase [Bacteroidales bacterium]|nr:4-alpha-glucanotransferase [Bacteroidales bacterium]
MVCSQSSFFAKQFIKRPQAMKFERSSGILLHPTSLPGNYGIGSLGKQALAFVDFLEKAGQKLWQVLPMGHTGYGDSPYQCFSIYAGNPILIDLDQLVDDGLLSKKDFSAIPDFPEDKVDYGSVIDFKRKMLKIAHKNFFEKSTDGQVEYYAFITENNQWLKDYATFVSLKELFGGKPWWEWPEEFKLRNNEALATYHSHSQFEISFHQFVQWLFFRQWKQVRKYANEKKIRIIGDIPLYVAHDSADVWSNHQLFQFDEKRNPLSVAGVPPDYFSKTGQLWGNPLYNWEVMQKNGFKWWLGRIKASFDLYDYVRIDHFRGFEAYWAVPFGEKTAINGEWIKAPGDELFETIRKELGTLSIIAEDLGIITPEVDALRMKYEFPGMKILQFAFDSDDEIKYLPHNYTDNFIVYTGTHDNDTLAGWFSSLNREIRKKVLFYADADNQTIIRKMIRLAWSSVARLAVIPLQDLLELDSSARMNTPGTASGNWQWRFTKNQLTRTHAEWLSKITKIYHR